MIFLKKGIDSVRINAVLLWVIFTLLISLLTLIMIILHGSINFDSEWIQPTTIATLIGGLGGALAGTVLSGINASRQWEKQEVKKTEENKFLFNKLIEESLSLMLVNKTSIMMLPSYTLLASKIKFGTGEESEYIDEMDERSRAKRLYNVIEDDMEDLYVELESLYSSIDDMVRGGIVDWETYSRVNYFKFAFGKTKAICSVRELADSSKLKDDELEERILGAEIESEELQGYRDVFNSRTEITSLYNFTLNVIEKLRQFHKDLSEKLK